MDCNIINSNITNIKKKYITYKDIIVIIVNLLYEIYYYY